MGSFYHTISPFIVRFSEDVGIRWYGMTYLLSFAAAYFILTKLAKAGRSPLAAERVADVLLTLIIGVLVGGRIGYCLFYEQRLLTEFDGSFPFWGVLKLTKGGMAFHGGLLGVIIAAWYVARGVQRPDGTRVHSMRLLALYDLLALATPSGIFLVRCANFINGELFGKIVSPAGEPGPWWAVKFPHEITSGQELRLDVEHQLKLQELLASQRLPGESIGQGAERLMGKILSGDHALAAKLEPLISARHPSQLYEAFGEGLVLGVLVWVAFLFKPRVGVIGSVFLLGYGTARFVSEFWRLPDSHLAGHSIMGLSRGQFFSSLMLLTGVVILAWIFRPSAGKTLVAP